MTTKSRGATEQAGWRMASPAMRLAILAACADTFYVLIDGLHFEPRCVDEFSKRRATLALRQPGGFAKTPQTKLTLLATSVLS